MAEADARGAGRLDHKVHRQQRESLASGCVSQSLIKTDERFRRGLFLAPDERGRELQGIRRPELVCDEQSHSPRPDRLERGDFPYLRPRLAQPLCRLGGFLPAHAFLANGAHDRGMTFERCAHQMTGTGSASKASMSARDRGSSSSAATSAELSQNISDLRCGRRAKSPERRGRHPSSVSVYPGLAVGRQMDEALPIG